MPIEGYKP